MRLTKSKLRGIIREELSRLTEDVDADSVLDDIKSFRLPKSGGRSNVVDTDIDKRRPGIGFNIYFRSWGDWESRNYLETESLRKAENAWQSFVERQSWSKYIVKADVYEEEKQYIRCSVYLKPEVVSEMPT